MALTLPDHVNPLIRRFHEYWLSKCRGGRLPSRDEIDPLEMRPFLPHVILFDVERRPGGLRFRNRLVGTYIVGLFGADVTGLYIEEKSAPAAFPALHERLATVVEERQPVYGIAEAPLPGRDFIRFEHLTAPLSSDGVVIDFLIGVRCAIGRDQ